MNNRYVVGVTHLVKPPFEPEKAALGKDIEVIHFATRDEKQFDVEQLKRLDIFLVWTPKISAETIAHLKNCKMLVRYGVGFDKIDIQSLQDSAIGFSNNPEYGPEDVADTAMSMLLGLQRGIYRHDRLCRTYQATDGWQENHITPTIHSRHCTVGVVGVGRIGISVINRLKAFGYRVIGYDPYISNGLARAVGIERMNSLEALFEQADMVTMHCPLTTDSKGMVNTSIIDRAKPGLIFVNTARGQLIDSLDTIEAGLRSGQLGGAGLDVLPLEPPDSHSLITAWRQDEPWLGGRLIVTPHNAFYSDHSMYECRYNAAETARLFIEEGVHRNKITA